MIQVVAAVITQDNKIFIAQRGHNRSHAGFWEFPGGKLEVGEDEWSCLARELNEELGIKATIGEYLGSVTFELSGQPAQLSAYIVPRFEGNITLREHLDARWVLPPELADYPMPAADIPFVHMLQARK